MTDESRSRVVRGVVSVEVIAFGGPDVELPTDVDGLTRGLLMEAIGGGSLGRVDAVIGQTVTLAEFHELVAAGGE